MKIRLISFEQINIGYQEAFLTNDTIKRKRHKKRHVKGDIIKEINNNILTISYFTEEAGYPTFEGGCLINENILTLYYQDVNYEPVKLSDFYELKYNINIENAKHEKINIVRINPVNKGLKFK